MQFALAVALLATDPSIANVAIDRYIESVPSRTGDPTDLMGTTVDGVPVRQRSIQSREKPEVLQAHFVKLFQKAKLYLAPEVMGIHGQAGLQVTGIDPENMVSYSVILQPNPQGTTIVVASADLGHLQTIKSDNAIGPVYPGAQHVTSSTMEGIHMMTYEVQATPAEIKAFYRDEYGKGGYAESGELNFVKGTDRATLTVSPGITKRMVMLQTGTQTPPKNEHPKMEKIAP
jgi:hypothetical protein